VGSSKIYNNHLWGERNYANHRCCIGRSVALVACSAGSHIISRCTQFTSTTSSHVADCWLNSRAVQRTSTISSNTL